MSTGADQAAIDAAAKERLEAMLRQYQQQAGAAPVMGGGAMMPGQAMAPMAPAGGMGFGMPTQPMGQMGPAQPMGGMMPIGGCGPMPNPTGISVPVTVPLPDGREVSCRVNFGPEAIGNLPGLVAACAQMFGQYLQARAPYRQNGGGWGNGGGGGGGGWGNGGRGGYGGGYGRGRW